YGCRILREGIQDEANNVTRFVWVAPEGTPPGIGSAEGKSWKTSLIFSELGEDKPGALVAALSEFSSRGINLSPSPSRPRSRRSGARRNRSESSAPTPSFNRPLPATLTISAHGQGAGAQCDV